MVRVAFAESVAELSLSAHRYVLDYTFSMCVCVHVCVCVCVCVHAYVWCECECVSMWLSSSSSQPQYVPTLYEYDQFKVPSKTHFLPFRFLELAQVKTNQDDDAAVIQYQVACRYPINNIRIIRNLNNMLRICHVLLPIVTSLQKLK